MLQIYGGYFLLDFMILLYCLSCRIWHAFGIDYAAVFSDYSYDCLDWRQVAELPCWSYFLLGLTLSMNFYYTRNDTIYEYYPALLIGLSTMVGFIPFRMCYYASRMWLLTSLRRVCLAGMYQVEWWDIYVADMLCSLTYSTGNISMFFCLYVQSWNSPEKCDSSHSRMLGFMTALPSIWRTLQCIRRYWDTNHESIHLLNGGKYMLTVSFYIALSAYRIHQTFPNRLSFIILAIVNSSVSCFWDVCHDWGLGKPHVRYPFLRRDLRFTSPWIYYAAILVNTLLRFTWIFYIVIPQQLQHSAVTSFGVSVGEVCRRGLWSLFRIENEYCSRIDSVEEIEVSSHRSWPFSKLPHTEANDRYSSNPIKLHYRNPTYTDDALIEGKSNARCAYSPLAVPKDVFSS
ncbi:Xenotropic and polytropic retrovirus receptor 1 [Exserohilum turcicum]